MKQALHFTGKGILGFFILVLVGFYADGQTNLAINKTVVASGDDGAGNTGDKAVDDSTSTRWSVQTYPQWLEIDLGDVYSINKTELVCHKDRDYQFIVEVKTTSDGSYDTLVDRSSNTTPGTIDAPITDSFASTDARYVKLTVTGAATYTGDYVSLREFRVFGDSINSPANSILFYDDCEDIYSASDWNQSGAAPTLSTAHHRNGSASYKFNKPSGSERSELSLKASAIPPINNFSYGQEYWIGWSVYVPANTSFSTFFTNGQFHDTNKPGDCDVAGQHSTIGIDLQSHQSGYRFRVISRAEADECGDKNYYPMHTEYSSLVNLDGWNDVVLHLKFNYATPGITQVWINGELVMDHKDPNAFNDPVGPYLKIGVYVGDADDNSVQTVYFDDIRIGNENSSYDDVVPEGPLPPVGIKTRQRQAGLQMSIYPNPLAGDNFSVEYKLQEASDVVVTILDEAGNTMKTFVNKNDGTGMRTLQVDAANYSTGMYFCKVVAGDKMVVKKFIVR